MNNGSFRVLKRYPKCTFVRPHDGGGVTTIHHRYRELRKNAEIYILVDIHTLQKQHAEIDLRVGIRPLLDELQRSDVHVGKIVTYDIIIAGTLPIPIASRVFERSIEYINDSLPLVLNLDPPKIQLLHINDILDQ